MKHQTVFTGAATALITPTNGDGIDYEAFKKLIEWQISEGIDGLVICGTTGEGATLTDQEHRAAIKFAVDTAAGRVPIIAGTGSNDTAYAIELTRYACSVGCDAMLCVTPYYNKTTQKGLVAMYNAIADASTKPVIVYNVPSRTGINIEPATCKELAKHPRIAGIKEASGNISQIMDMVAAVGDEMDIYSGNDDQIVPIMACGGKGVISVLSNVAPRETHEMCQAMLDGNCKEAMKLQTKYLPVIHSLFCEVNPIPVKAAMAAMGFCENYVRMPLVTMDEEKRQVMLQHMRDTGILR